MTEIDPALARTLERLAPCEPAPPAWDDVLSRARRGRRGRMLAGAAVAAVVAVAVVGLATPALGLETPFRGLLGFDKRPPLELTAHLTAVAGSGSGTFFARPFASFTPVGSGRAAGFPPHVGYLLAYRGLSGKATEVRLRAAPPIRGKGTGFVVHLCGPCKSPMRGTIRHPGLALALLVGRVSVEVATAAHPDGELRGRVVPRR